MKIEVLYIHGCPGYLPTMAMIEQIVTQGRIQATIGATEIADPNTPGFRGSPTVRINGEDIERGTLTAACGLACRRYQSDGKFQNTPSREMIKAAIERAKS